MKGRSSYLPYMSVPSRKSWVFGCFLKLTLRFAQSLSLTSPDPKAYRALPRVSIVVSLWGYLIRMLTIKSVQPKKGTAMETIR